MKPEPGDKVITKVTNMDLFTKTCPICNQITIFGFYQQIKWLATDTGGYFDRECKNCSHRDRLFWVDGGFSMGAGI